MEQIGLFGKEIKKETEGTFFNTVPETGAALKESKRKAKTEEDLIIAFFTANGHTDFSPCQVWKHIDFHRPVTNFRRAITVLTNKGILEQTGKKITGHFGKPVNTWRLVKI